MTEVHPDFPDAADPNLLEWLAGEMDEELLEHLYQFWVRAKGLPGERPAADMDLDAVERFHLTGFDELFDGVRSDDYLVGDRRYWAAIHLCPTADCDCHDVEVVFFDPEDGPDAAEVVGAVRLHLGGAEGFEISETVVETGASEPLVQELWALFARRHDVAQDLRRREAQAKALGATLWHPVARPVRVAPKPGRNQPCPCGSGVKYKRCCLGKESPKRP